MNHQKIIKIPIKKNIYKSQIAKMINQMKTKFK